MELHSTQNSKKVKLGYWTCYFVDIPENTSSLEIVSPKEGDDTLYKCFFETEYLFGKNAGPAVCITLCILVSIIGVYGVASNVVNILVLRQSTKGSSSLQKLLLILAGFDMIASLCAVLTSVLIQIVLDDIDRKKSTMIAVKAFFLLYSLGRTGSIFMTILITAERYFVVAHLFRAKAWLGTRGPFIVTLIWLFFIVLMIVPWSLNSELISSPHNPAGSVSRATGPLANFPYIFVSTKFSKEIYYANWFHHIHDFIDFALPLPLLLLFNGLLYRFIYIWNKNRKSLTTCQIREVNAAKMFSIVVLALFSCHTISIIDFIITTLTNKVYREFHLFITLTVTINAAINSFVYYACGKDYREKFRILFGFKIYRQTRNSDRKMDFATVGENPQSSSSGTSHSIPESKIN